MHWNLELSIHRVLFGYHWLIVKVQNKSDYLKIEIIILKLYVDQIVNIISINSCSVPNAHNRLNTIECLRVIFANVCQ